ncbi:recombinase RmuC [Ventosimonas gracilis]|uniref:Recombinase RmuC n=1 Tax=Ventosimonas gracilis TaxID=1680762 RepID=A0A139SPX2_9GAMM|nr:DNA recombination protein RmuC [Ventosimonas gracilis]KXU36598.1 recombinase RmuC [Ventosimonas gracilis]
MLVDVISVVTGALLAAAPLAFWLWRSEQVKARQQLELERLREAGAANQSELAALRRESLLLAEERKTGTYEREQKEAELRRLASERAAMQAQLASQQESSRQRLTDLQAARDELRAQFAELAGKIFDAREQRFSETSGQQLTQLLEPLRERIGHFEKRVEESYQNEARERFSLANELKQLQTLNQRLGDEASRLSLALKGQKTQGSWGEMVLERVLEHAGLEKGREYQTQVSLRNEEGERLQPDALINLPGGRQVVVDAKVSLTVWQQLIDCTDENERLALQKQHVASLKKHIKGLAPKDYQRLVGLQSLDFVLIFVPIEAAFAAALQIEPGLLQEAYQQQIIIVSPTTMLATLRLIESLWRQERQSQNAREIAEAAGSLYDKFVGLINDLEDIGKQLKKLDETYSKARNKLDSGRGNLIGRVESLRKLGARVSKHLPTELLERATAYPQEKAEGD